jgi:hypothetical protein
MKNHQKQTTKNNYPQKQVYINKTNTVNKNIPQKAVPKLDNSVINLIKRTCVRMMCKEIKKINDVTTKRTPRPYIKIETIKGENGIGCLTLVQASHACAFRRIAKECRP